MRSYEVVVIVHPDLDEKAFTEVLDRVQGWITEADGKVTKVDLWGKKKLAYEIRKQTEGQYVIIYADMNPTFCSELERNLQLNGIWELESVVVYTPISLRVKPYIKCLVLLVRLLNLPMQLLLLLLLVGILH